MIKGSRLFVDLFKEMLFGIGDGRVIFMFYYVMPMIAFFFSKEKFRILFLLLPIIITLIFMWAKSIRTPY